MVNHPNRGKRIVRLTPAQINILIDAGEFILAGEWPWDERRPETLRRAIETLHTAS